MKELTLLLVFVISLENVKGQTNGFYDNFLLRNRELTSGQPCWQYGNPCDCQNQHLSNYESDYQIQYISWQQYRNIIDFLQKRGRKGTGEGSVVTVEQVTETSQDANTSRYPKEEKIQPDIVEDVNVNTLETDDRRITEKKEVATETSNTDSEPNIVEADDTDYTEKDSEEEVSSSKKSEKIVQNAATTVSDDDNSKPKDTVSWLRF